MKKGTRAPQARVTLAEVCEAIVSEKLPTQIEDGYYTVDYWTLRHMDPRTRLVHKLRRSPHHTAFAGAPPLPQHALTARPEYGIIGPIKRGNL